MSDDNKPTETVAQMAVTTPPSFTRWKDFEDVNDVVDSGGVVPGILYGRHRPSDDAVFLLREGLSDGLKQAAIERAGVPHRNGSWWVIIVPDAPFGDKIRSVTRAAKRKRDQSVPPGVWMAVEEAAERSPGGTEKARKWIKRIGLARVLDGTPFVLTEEWIAALHSAPKAADSSKGGE